MKIKIIGFFLAFVCVIGLSVIISGCQDSLDFTTTTTTSTTSTTAAPALGITNISPYATTGVSVSSISSASGVKGFVVPSDLELNVTFDYFKLYDGTTWTSITTLPVTVNLLGAISTSGASVAITPPPAGTYTQLKMGISAVYFSQPGQTNRDVLAMLKAQGSGSEDWDAMVMPLLPFTYSSGNLSFNMYMPASNISGSSYSDYFPAEGPVFNFTGGSVSTTAGTINITISSGVTAGNSLFVGAFQNIEQDGGPAFTGILSNAGDGSASGSISVPAGSWNIMAVESSGSMGVGGPGEGAIVYTAGGGLPWEGGLSPTTVAAGGSASASLAYAFTITSTMGSGGAGKAPSGTASIQFTLQPSPAAITLSNSTELMLYAYSSLANFQNGGAPEFFLGSKSIAAGSFSTTTLIASGLGAGDYVVIGFLDVSGSGRPAAGVDYLGGYGGFPVPSVITLVAGQTLDVTGSPMYLSLYSN